MNLEQIAWVSQELRMISSYREKLEEEYGITTTVYRDAKQALEAMYEGDQRYDLILVSPLLAVGLDNKWEPQLSVPKLGNPIYGVGFGTIEMLTSPESYNNHTPIIGVSVIDAPKQGCLRSGAVGFVDLVDTKPSEFYDAIQKEFARYEQTQQLRTPGQ